MTDKEFFVFESRATIRRVGSILVWSRPGVAVAAAVAMSFALSACSSDSDSAPAPTQATPDVGRSPKVTLPSPAPREAAPQLARIAGFTYGQAPTAIQNQVDALVKQNRQVVTASTVRERISKSGRAGNIAVFKLNEKYVPNELFRRQIASSLVAGVAGSEGGSVKPVKVERLPAFITEGNTTAVGFYRTSLIVVVTGGQDRDEVLGFAKAYVQQ